jgi:outer membrane protein OmpA-like peptidoglycan-associated protein
MENVVKIKYWQSKTKTIMIKTIIILLFSTSLAMAQVVKNPVVERQTTLAISITGVEKTKDASVISFVFYPESLPDIDTKIMEDLGGGTIKTRDKTRQTMSFDPNSYLFDPKTKKIYRFKSAKKIAVFPEKTELLVHQSATFTATFEKLDEGIDAFDLLEGQDSKYSNERHWNFWNVQLIKPKQTTFEDVKIGETIALKNILFEVSTAILKPDSYKALDELRVAMQTNLKLKIRLDGHTDNVGDVALNLQLSVDRVLAVKKYLIGKNIDAKRIETKGYGGSKPLNKNQNEVEKMANRRVEVVVLEK